MSSSNTPAAQPDLVDVRGPRFAAWVTTAVLVITLLVSALSPAAAAVVLGLQALVFAVVGAAAFAGGASLVGIIATAGALVAAFLNAAFGICLGCQLYPLVARFRRTPHPA